MFTMYTYTLYTSGPMPTSRSAILTTAWRLFARQGLAGITMRRIAERNRVTPMALYRHYPSKEALVDALIDEAFAGWEARVAAIAEPDPRAWLVRWGDEYVDFALDDPRRFEAAFLLRSPHIRRFPDDFAAGKSPAFALAIPRIEACVASGRFRAGPPLEIAMSLWSHAHGLVVLHRTGRFSVADDQLRAIYRRSIARLLDGIETPRRKGRTR